jgi:hypothetical protein
MLTHIYDNFNYFIIAPMDCRLFGLSISPPPLGIHYVITYATFLGDF